MTLAEAYKLIKCSNELLESGKRIPYILRHGDTSCVLSEGKKKETPQPVDNREVIQHENGIKYRKPKVAKVYPDAVADPMLTNAEKQLIPLHTLYPEDMKFFLCDRSKDPRLKDLNNGEFYIQGKVVYKEVGNKRLKKTTALHTLRSAIDGRFCILNDTNHTTGTPVYKIYCFNPNKEGPQRYSRIIVELEGEYANGIDTYYPCKTPTEVKRIKQETIAAGYNFPE